MLPRTMLEQADRKRCVNSAPALTNNERMRFDMADIPTKRCRRCNQELPHSDFYRDKRSSDGCCTQCRTCMNNGKKERRAADPERARAIFRDDYHRNKARYMRASKRYQAKNWDRFIGWTSHQDAIRRCQHKPAITSAEYAEWRISAEKVCHWCGVSCRENFHVDHIIPLSRGGHHDFHNITIACASCNARKGARMPEDFLRILREKP